MRISITCQCPHCNKPIFGQQILRESPVEVNVRAAMPPERLPQIVRKVAEQTGYDVCELQGRSTGRQVSRARQIAFYECRNAGYSWNAIGEFFGGRDHSTVKHGYNKISMEMITQ